jgi:hypothetical protein
MTAARTFTITDTFGAKVGLIEEVQLIRVDRYTRISIYNSAGELVRRMEVPQVDSNIVNLKVDDTFFISNDSTSTTIKFGDTGALQWDGKNSMGTLVGSGTYEIFVE